MLRNGILVRVKKISSVVVAGLLRRFVVPAVLIPGLVMAAALGWRDWRDLGPNYYDSKAVFANAASVVEAYDGDTVYLDNNMIVRLVGINAPDRGQVGYEGAGKKLEDLVLNKKVWLEYDRYKDDKYGRVLAWLWVGCEAKPKFLPNNYMHKTNNESNLGLTSNPVGCKKGKLVQEEMVKAGKAETVSYKDRGELKYEKRIGAIVGL